MGRFSLFTVLLTLSVAKLSAQSAGYSNLEFVENKGQWDSQVKFRATMNTGALFLQQKGFTVLLQDTNDLRAVSERSHFVRRKNVGSKVAAAATNRYAAKPGGGGGSGPAEGGPPTIRSHAYRMSFAQANENAEIIPEKPIPSYNNYIIGNDRSKWASNCKIYQGITYKDVYPGVDLHYYSDGGRLKYDLVVHPGADPSRIAMKYEGQDGLALRKGMLVVKTSVSEVKELVPYSYQPNETGKKEVSCKYELSSDNTIHFKIQDYDPQTTLVIDPVIVFCTFTGSTVDNWGFTATYGSDGSMYVAGIVAGAGWPVSVGAFISGSNAGPHEAPYNYWDVGVMKLNSNGSSRVYATYLGGGGNEYPHSLVCDNSGQLVVMGRTYSTDFPQTTTAYQGAGADIFVTKLNVNGSAPIGSMRIGGSGSDGVNIVDQGDIAIRQVPPDPEKLQSLIRNYGDWSRSEVILDAVNNIYVAGCTQSKDFPKAGNASQPSYIGGGTYGQDGVVLKIDPTCNQLLCTEFLGGTNDDAALVMEINPTNNDLYVGGSTLSTDFPGASVGWQKTFGGQISGFVSHFTNNGNSLTLQGSSYLSSTVGGSIDMIYGVKLDKSGYPYAMGTSTANWVATPNVARFDAGAKQFVVKLTPDLSGMSYITTFGSPNATKPNISPVAFLVDRCENVYISGWGGWYTDASEEPDPYYLQGTLGMPITPDAAQSTTDNRDFYFIVLQRNSAKLLYGTFFGEKDDATSISEHVDGGTSRYDKNGIIFQAICANCYRGDYHASNYIPYPTTNGSWSVHNGSGNNGCNLAALKIAFNFSGVSAGLKTTLKGRGDSLGCVPLTVTFQDTVRNAQSYFWNLDNGQGTFASPNNSQTWTYTNPGVYHIMLVAYDPNSCNVYDTTYMNVTARTDSASVDFSYGRPPGVPCTSMEYQFNNLSVPGGSSKPFTEQSFTWFFGDGGTVPQAGLESQIHSYQSSGSYNVSLILTDTNYCNAPDTVTKPLFVAQNVKAQFVTPPFGCAPYYAVFNNTSIAGQKFYWDFGDGSGIDSVDRTPPPHYYPNIGTYTITLKAVDSTTCNIVSDTAVTINVYAKPTSLFSYVPNPPVANTPDVFTNLSSGGTQYKWIFGDGDTAVRNTMDTVMHQYNATGTFTACLVVFNQYGCTDTTCQQVQVLINPLLDVPNAFTPGRFGQNAIIKVMGFGIAKMTWRIYNRWGQVVFISNDPNMGWDGTYDGKQQPMDVYAYTLEAEFSNGKHATRKGDITLLR